MNQGHWYERVGGLEEVARTDSHAAGLEGLRLLEDWLFEQAKDLGYRKSRGGMREYVDYIRKRGRLSNADAARAHRFGDVRNCVSHRSGLLMSPELADELLGYLTTLFRADALDAEHLMTPDPHTVSPEDNLREVTDWMLGEGVSRLPVLSGGRVIALLTNRDVLAMQAREPDGARRASLTVADAMRLDSLEQLAYLPRRAPYDEVLAHLQRPGVATIFVTERGLEEEPLLGVICVTDLLPKL